MASNLLSKESEEKINKENDALEIFRIIKFKTINAGYDYGFKCWDTIEQALIKAKEKEKNI